jgi:large subunit ribosomal protein L32e
MSNSTNANNKSTNKSNNTNTVKRLLDVRKDLKSKKPLFRQQDFHKKSRLSAKWKRPTGLQSKMRHQFKGYARRVKQGWRSPSLIRDFHGKGFKIVFLNNLKDVETIILKDNEAILIGNVGMKKKLAIAKRAVERNLRLINTDYSELQKTADELLANKKKSKVEKQEKKKKSIEDALKKADKKEKDKKDKKDKKDDALKSDSDKNDVLTLSEEDKKEKEKQEKDEVLIHKS